MRLFRHFRDHVIRYAYKLALILHIREKVVTKPAHKSTRKWNEYTNAPSGAFTDLRSVLSALDDVFGRLEKLSATDVPGAIRKHGATIVSDNWGEGGLELTDNLSSHGFRAYGLPSMLFSAVDANRWHTTSAQEAGNNEAPEFDHFAWALKKNKGYHVRVGSDWTVYEVGVLFPKRRGGKAFHQEFMVHEWVAVNKNTGRIKALPTYDTSPTTVQRNGKRPLTICQPRWRYYPGLFLSDPERERCHSIEVRKQSLVHDFAIIYQFAMWREFGTNIVVKKGGNKAVFVVPENRWKYFFRERIDATTAAGKKRPIFHAVVTHKRILSDGRETTVKTHYRGSRYFRWGEYDVSIVIPGKHGKSMATFNPEAMSVASDTERESGMVELQDVDLSSAFGHR